MSTVPPNEAKQDWIERSVKMGSDATRDARVEQAGPYTVADKAVKAAADNEASVSPTVARPEQLKSETIAIPLHDVLIRNANGDLVRGSNLIFTGWRAKAIARVNVETLQQYKRSTSSAPKVQAASDEMMLAMRISRPPRCPTRTVEGFFKDAEQELLRTLSEAIDGAVKKDHWPTFREASRPNRERARLNYAATMGSRPFEDEQP